MSRPELVTATAWAVFLGCTTARRMAREMGITPSRARDRLKTAHRRGLIRRVRPGVYKALQ